MNHALTKNEQIAWDLKQRGLSERSIALALDISRSAVQSRLENARRKLDRQARQEPAA